MWKHIWKRDRVVYGARLERGCRVTCRGFESLRFRHFTKALVKVMMVEPNDFSVMNPARTER